MPDAAIRLVNTTPSSTPCAKTEVHIFTVRRRKELIETTQFKKLVSVNSHKAAGGKQRVTSLLMLRVEVPIVKAMFEVKAGWATGDLGSIPIIAACRNREDVGQLEMPHQR